MRAPLSIVIPTLNAAPVLGDCVAGLFEGLEAGLIRELIVSDGGSGDATPQMAENLGAVLLRGTAGRGGQLKRGADLATGDWLLFLHADTRLDAGWSAHVRAHIEIQNKAGCFKLKFRATGPKAAFVAGWANLRTRLFGLPYGDQGLLLSRELYDRIGGYEDIPLMEDVAIARALKGQLIMLEGFAATDATKYQAEGWFWRGTRNLWTMVQYFGGVAPDKLARQYRR